MRTVLALHAHPDDEVRKQAALAAHASQLRRGRGGRLMFLLTRVPVPLFGLLMGREWFAERPRSPAVSLRQLTLRP